MPEIETIFVLLAAVATLATLANRIGVPYPILLVLGGLVLGFVPGLPRVELEPEVVFLLFLPPLLYVSAIFTSWRDFLDEPAKDLSVGRGPRAGDCLYCGRGGSLTGRWGYRGARLSSSAPSSLPRTL